MKKSRKILITIILSIIAIASIYIFLKGQKFVKGATFLDGENLIIDISSEQMKNEYNNIYSVSQIQQLIFSNDTHRFETTSLAEIRGEEVTFTNYYSGSTDYLAKNVIARTGNTCLENNIMAAIISGAGVENTGFKYLTADGYYHSGAQLAIFEFWNTWVENSGAKENGFEKGMGNMTTSENGLDGEEQRKSAQELAKSKNYNVNIYFLKYLAHNNLTEDGSLAIENQPNLIFIEIVDENGILVEPEEIVDENSDISLSVSKNTEGIIEVGQEILYTVSVYNRSEEEQQNLILKNILPEGTTFVKAIEIIDYNEVDLIENTDYNYNQDARILTINMNPINGMKSSTTTDNTTGETVESIELGSRNYKIIIKSDELQEGMYSREIKSIVKVQNENSLLAKEEIINTISDVCLEVEKQELPETVNEKDDCILGLKVTNKGLINAKNVNVKISIPEEILARTYKIIILSETGEEESVIEGTTTNEFENNSIGIPSQKTAYIQILGTVKEIEETKQITFEGNVNDEKVSWTTEVQK